MPMPMPLPVRLRVRIAAAAALATAAALLAAPGPAVAAATACTTTLWTAGTGGYHTYRIPAIVNAGGTLIAVAEGRRTSGADSGDIELVERRSTDGGCTWTPAQVVADSLHNAVGNPAMVVAPGGDVVLLSMWQHEDATQESIQDGTTPPEDGRRVYVQRSRDRGVTWTGRREITSSVKDLSWRWYATGPGHGIAIARGGPGVSPTRLVVGADHTGTTGNQRGMQLLISDDGGWTWHLGPVDTHQAPEDPVRPGETSVAELMDGRLYVSSRSDGGWTPAPPVGRIHTYATGSGDTLTGPSQPVPGFVTPEVEGSVLQDPGLPAGVSCHPLLYSGPEDPAVRRHLTIRRSDDDGATWRTVSTITGPTVPAAYSDIVKTGRTTLGVLYETGTASPYERIVFRSVSVTCP